MQIKIIYILASLFSFSIFANESQFRRSCYIKPCTYRGDFDGDKREDLAVLIANKDGWKGIEVKFANKKIVTIGAGEAFGNGGANFNWMDRWSLPKGMIEQGATEAEKPPAPKGDSLLLEKTNSASGLVYWDGSEFRWYQQGD